MTNTENLQDVMLEELCAQRTPATFFLVNGYQLRGVVEGFDSSVVVFNSFGEQQMIYKHAISTIVPMWPWDKV